MTQYLLSVHGSEGGNYTSDDDMQRAFADVEAFNADLQKAGAWVFAGGLMPASTAWVVTMREGVAESSVGPYLQGSEHLGGFWVIEAADDAAAQQWAQRATAACQVGVEVRPFQGIPSD